MTSCVPIRDEMGVYKNAGRVYTAETAPGVYRLALYSTAFINDHKKPDDERESQPQDFNL
jgi:hypothetical protein